MQKFRKLSDAELRLMEVVWSMEEPVTTGDLHAHLQASGMDWKPQTVLTLLSRIEDKHLISSVKQGKERQYFILVNRQMYRDFETDSFLNRFYPRSMAGFLGDAIRKGALTKEDLAELEQMLHTEE